MDNNTVHLEYELPSTKKLLISMGIALGTALLVLTLFVLPAEYGIDPTGIGKIVGLKNMGDIKQSLAQEQAAADTAVEKEPCKEQIPAVVEESADVNADTVTITLKPGEAAELKLVMDEDAVADYTWGVDQGHLNFDVHGDKPGTKYYGYSKGKRKTTDSGQLKAAFKGKHGWFWRNRSEVTVTLVLMVKGDYSAIKRVV